jgi:hypothetical protein
VEAGALRPDYLSKHDFPAADEEMEFNHESRRLFLQPSGRPEELSAVRDYALVGTRKQFRE